jgi:hypothetical protein
MHHYMVEISVYQLTTVLAAFAQLLQALLLLLMRLYLYDNLRLRYLHAQLTASMHV